MNEPTWIGVMYLRNGERCISYINGDDEIAEVAAWIQRNPEAVFLESWILPKCEPMEGKP